MKLNPDCIRDILLCVENGTSLKAPLSINYCNVPDVLSDYSFDEISYHAKQAELSGLISVMSWYYDGGFAIKYLLPAGHEFLSNIRNDSNWVKVKEISQKIGSSSLDVLKSIAANVISSLLRSYYD